MEEPNDPIEVVVEAPTTAKKGKWLFSNTLLCSWSDNMWRGTCCHACPRVRMDVYDQRWGHYNCSCNRQPELGAMRPWMDKEPKPNM